MSGASAAETPWKEWSKDGTDWLRTYARYLVNQGQDKDAERMLDAATTIDEQALDIARLKGAVQRLEEQREATIRALDVTSYDLWSDDD